LHKILSLIEEKAYKQAHEYCIALIHADVTDPRPYCGLAQIALDHKNTRKALELFETARKYAPDDPFYIVQHAKALTLIGRNDDAKKLVDIAAEKESTDAHVADMIGVIYSRTGFHEHAISFFEKAVNLNPAPANFYFNLAASQQFSGDFSGAEESYKNALARDPALFRASSALASLKKQTTTENNLTALEAEFSASAQDANAALHLGHAIAKTYEDLGQHETSLQWLHKAKMRKRAELDYDIENDLALFQTVRGAESVLADKTTPSEAAPIFIVGLPRTGTTLIDRILSSHRDVVSAGELNIFAELIKKQTKTPSQMVMDAETFQAAHHISVTQLGYDYINKTHDLARGSRRFTDKMPLNFFYSGLIHRALPNARIVALRRGAMDSCLSNYRQLFATKFSYYNYTFDLDDTARYYTAFDGLMSYWCSKLPANRFMEIRYEDVIHQQEVQTQKLLEFCGLEWDEACLRFHENSAPVSTASSVQVRQPLYSGSIDRWKKYGNRLDGLKNTLGPLAKP